MPYSESLAACARDALARVDRVAEKKMFGGLCFLIGGKLLVGVFGDSLIARVGPAEADAALRKSHVKPFDVAGRPMKAWVVVEPDGLDGDRPLRQ